MSDFQKNIVDKLLKERKQSKRELAKFLNIKENSINRSLKSPNISIRKLEKIAEFLEIDPTELVQMKNSMRVQEDSEEYKSAKNIGQSEQTVLAQLAEIIKIQGRTIETMVETEKTKSRNIENLVKLITDKYEIRQRNAQEQGTKNPVT